MGDPELRNDEKVLVRTPGVYVKSIPFEGILTSKRVILIDRAKNLLPPKEIPLATIKEVEAGENAIRDQTLTISVMAKTGETRQMILTFSRQEGGNRIKERDEWARLIRANIGSSFENVIRKVIPGTDASPRRATPVAAPVPAATEPSVLSGNRDTDNIHPITKILNAEPVPEAKGPDSSLPGQTVFCTRCGSKVPPDSSFCNRCGSPVIAPGASPASAPPAPASGIPAPYLRPIDRDIQTIEPLIERSMEKIPADPLRKTIPDVPVQQSLLWDDEISPSPAPVPVTAPASAPSSPVTPEEQPEKKGFIPRLFSPKARTQASPRPESPLPAAAPPVPQKPRSGLGFNPGRNLLMGLGALVVILIIVVIGYVFVYPMLANGESPVTPVATSAATPAPTTSAAKPSGTFVVPKETQAPDIPKDGVYVHVNYLGGFKGSYGIPAAITTVPGNSGDQIWQVENATTVQANFEKLDGSAHELLVEIYKNGAVLTKGTTTIGHGSVILSVDTATGIAATPITSGNSPTAASATTSATPTPPPTTTNTTSTINPAITP
jgi:hypothetical protein